MRFFKLKKFLNNALTTVLGIFSLTGLNTNSISSNVKENVLSNNSNITTISKNITSKKAVRKKIVFGENEKPKKLINARGGKSNKPLFIPVLNDEVEKRYYDPKCWSLIPYKEQNSFSNSFKQAGRDLLLPGLTDKGINESVVENNNQQKLENQKKQKSRETVSLKSVTDIRCIYRPFKYVAYGKDFYEALSNSYLLHFNDWTRENKEYYCNLRKKRDELIIIPTLDETSGYQKVYLKSWDRRIKHTQYTIVRNHAKYKGFGPDFYPGLTDFYCLNPNYWTNDRYYSGVSDKVNLGYISQYEKAKYNPNIDLNPYVQFVPTFGNLRNYKFARLGQYPASYEKSRYKLQRPSEPRYATIEKFYLTRPVEYQRHRSSTTFLPRAYVYFNKKHDQFRRFYRKYYRKITRPFRPMIRNINIVKGKVKEAGQKFTKWANDKTKKWGGSGENIDMSNIKVYKDGMYREGLYIGDRHIDDMRGGTPVDITHLLTDVMEEYPPFHEPVRISKIVHKKEYEGIAEQYLRNIFEEVGGSIEKYIKRVYDIDDISWARFMYDKFSINDFPFLYREGYCYEDELPNLAAHHDMADSMDYITIIPCSWMKDHVKDTGLLRIVHLSYRDPSYCDPEQQFKLANIPGFPGINSFRLVTDKKDFLSVTNSNRVRFNLNHLNYLFDLNGRYEYYCPSFQKGGIVIKNVMRRRFGKSLSQRKHPKILLLDPYKRVEEFENHYKQGLEWGKYRLETRPVPLWTVFWDNPLYRKRGREKRKYNKLFRVRYAENNDSHKWGVVRQTVDGRYTIRQCRKIVLRRRKQYSWPLSIQPNLRIYPYQNYPDYSRSFFRIDPEFFNMRYAPELLVYFQEAENGVKLSSWGAFKKKMSRKWDVFKYRAIEFLKDITIRKFYRDPHVRRKDATTYMLQSETSMPFSKRVPEATKQLIPCIDVHWAVSKREGFGKILEWRKPFYSSGPFRDERLAEEYDNRGIYWIGIPSLKYTLELCKKYNIVHRADQIDFVRIGELFENHYEAIGKDDLIDEEFMSSPTIPYNIDRQVFNRRYINPKRDKDNLPLFGLHRDYEREDNFGLLVHDYLKYGILGIPHYSYTESLETIFKYNKKLRFFYHMNSIRRNDRDSKSVNFSYPQVDNYGDLIHNYPYPQGDETSKRMFCYPCLYFDSNNNIVVEKKYYNWALFYPYFYPKPDDPNLITPQEYWEKQHIWIKKYLDENKNENEN